MIPFLRRCCGLHRPAMSFGYQVCRSAVAFVVITALAYGLCQALPALREALAGYIFSHYENLLVLDQAPRIPAAERFVNNMWACAFTMVFGLMPFLLLPAYTLGSNAITIGVLGAWYTAKGHSLWAYLAALLPHGLFEIPALVLAVAMGLHICGNTDRWILGDKNAPGQGACLFMVFKMLPVLIPLLGAAAFLEAYITPAFAALFL